MKAATISHLLLGLYIISFFVFSPGLSPCQAQPQEGETEAQEPAEKYSREELAQMLAPIALYPDALLSQVLMASTYPIEVIEADRWRKQNPKLQNEALDAAMLDQDWDASVKAICHFPSILSLMSERISETTNIGNAFLAQEAEVMDMVQELRARAREQGNLTTTPEQKVVVQKETIIIEPANPRVIYVPYYDPYTIYGPWWYPAYRPYYWGPPGISIGFGISYWPGFYFGFSFGDWVYFDWHRHYIRYHVHKRPRFVRHERWVSKPGPWRHAPHHRRGVAYRDKHTARKYGQHHYRSRGYRPDTRGFPDGRRQDRDRDRRDDGRTRIDRDQQGDTRSRLDRDRRERQRVEQERQIQQQQPDRERRERQRVEQERQIQQQQPDRERRERQRVEQERQIQQQQPDRERRERQRVEQERQIQQQQPDRERRERQRVEQERQIQQQQPDRERRERQRVEQERQIQQRAERQRRPPERVDSDKAVRKARPPYQGSDDVFNRVDNGRRERQSSERGRSSRQQGRSGDFRGKSRWGDGDSGGRYDRGRDDRNRPGR